MVLQKSDKTVRLIKVFLLQHAVDLLKLLHVVALLDVLEVQMVDGNAVILLGHDCWLHRVGHDSRVYYRLNTTMLW